MDVVRSGKKTLPVINLGSIKGSEFLVQLDYYQLLKRTLL
jgi:hypothetical protein